MGKRIFVVVTFCLSAGILYAQKVLYSPFIGTQPETRFEVIGKAGDYYWIQKSRKKSRTKNSTEPWTNDKDLSLEVYDARMNFVKTIPSFISNNLIKEYFVPGEKYLDQLLLLPAEQEIVAVVNHYAPDGSLLTQVDTVGEFPANMKCGDFLLVRSGDKNKILLLGFEPVPESPPKLHALLFDKSWKLIHRTLSSNNNISKPLVQYELVDYPLEDYSSAPIKLGNDGGWLMTTGSNTNHNYLLLHFRGLDDSFVSREIKMSQPTSIEETGLYLDNDKQEAFVGVLSRIRLPAIKNVRVANYSLTNCQVIFDTSYSFNTLAANKIKNENIFEEYFMTVPGKGFIFLKEYGRTFSPEHGIEDYNERYEQLPEISKEVVAGRGIINKNDYTRYNNFAGTRKNFDRGDLTVYFLPARPSDSCWSGIINKEQVTELGSSYLSYVFLPRKDKLFFLYNSFYRNREQYSSTTVLDEKGNPLNEGVEYWKINNTLVFQKARQISENELAIPYEKNWRNGFAIIKL
ncbi:MAG: hypothetical protein E6H06_16010 [Bacteroidetes bacterium]|nr:MAG: hypothetical protein E6H06_16010 [Bacteroidota bacterium]